LKTIIVLTKIKLKTKKDKTVIKTERLKKTRKRGNEKKLIKVENKSLTTL